MPLDYSATSNTVTVPASTSLANKTVLTSWAWVNLRTYSNFRIWQKGYVGRDGFAHYFGGGTTALEYQFFRTAGGGLNYAANYTNFAYWGANKWLFILVATNANASTKLYVGDLNNPPAEPSAYSFAIPGTGAFNNDSAIALDWGNRGAGATNLDGLLHSGGWYPAIFDYLEIKRVWATRPRLWSRMYQHSSGLWRFGSNGRGTVLDESSNNNHGTLTGAVPVSSNLPRDSDLGELSQL